MQFRLVYKGQLPAAKWVDETRRVEKHQIRCALHRQLAVLWKEEPILKDWSSMMPDSVVSTLHQDCPRSVLTGLADNYEKFGFRWVPLINQRYGIACSLDILFLRRDPPGKILQSGGGGDIDNRLKVLFDALRVPKEGKEVSGFSPESDQNPFFCLLEDDCLINHVRVETDRLLTPLAGDEAVNDVELVIHVKTLVTNARKAPVDFYL